MSSVVVSGDSSDGAPSEATGGEGNPIELDDSSTNSNDNSNNNSNSGTETETEIPPAPVKVKKEDKNEDDCGDADSDDDKGDENENDDDESKDDGGGDDDSGEDGDEEVSEGDGDGDDEIMNNDAAGPTVDEESEIENKSDDDDDNDGNDNDDSDNSDDNSDDNNDDDDGSDSSDSAAKGSKDASIKRSVQRKELMGNIESMSEIVKSPYDGNECAEVGEDCFEELRLLWDRGTDGKINPRMVALVGDKLALDLCNVHHEIGKSGMLYSANWKEGKIRESDFGWIPKRQLLLCLHEHRFANGDVIVLQAITKNLDCTKLVLEAMKLWDLMDTYPNLASNRNEETFVFGVKKIFSYKCQIFVARAFATLQILNKTEGIQQSLTKKIKACLSIMNEHVRVNQIELARMRRKAQKRKALEAPPSSEEQPDVGVSMDLKGPRSRRVEHSGSRAKVVPVAASSRVAKPRGPGPKSGAKKPTRKRRRKVPKREEREESIFMLFNTMHLQVQRLNQMMSFFQSQLQDHRGILREEIRETLEKDGTAKR